MLAPLLFLLLTLHQSRPSLPPRDAAPATTATGSVAGRITEQGSGRPLPGALVTLWVPSSEPREVVTDLQGRYAFTLLEPGEYSVSARPGEFRATHLHQVFGQKEPRNLTGGPPKPNVELKAGQAMVSVDIALARALAIEGRVLDPSSEPMAGVEVRVTRADGSQPAVRSVNSDDRGEFRLFGLAPGRYRVCAFPEGPFIATLGDTGRPVRTCHLAATSESAATEIFLGAENASGVDIRIQRGGTYSLSGSVVDSAGTLVDGAFVGAFPLDREVSAHDRSRKGEFSLKGLTPGRYAVMASIGGPDNPSDRRPPAREQELGYVSIVVDGADQAGIQVVLSKGQTISGRVRFDGSPTPRPNQSRMVVQTRESNPFGSGVLGSRPPFSAVDDKLEFELKDVYRVPLIVGIERSPEGWVLGSVAYGGREITNTPTDFGAERRARLEITLTKAPPPK